MKNVKIIDFPKILDKRGNLSFIESHNHIPFEIERVYWIYDVPGGEIRGGHAYKMLSEVIIALSGSLDVIIDDGYSKECFSLNRSYHGLLVPKLYWRSLENFSTNALCLILANLPYDENDYLRDYIEYQKLVKIEKQ